MSTNKVLGRKECEERALAAVSTLSQGETEYKTMDAILNDRELCLKLDSTGKIITTWTIRNWRILGNMPSFRVGRRIFFRWSSVLDWLDVQEKLSEKSAPESEYGKLRKVK